MNPLTSTRPNAPAVKTVGRAVPSPAAIELGLVGRDVPTAPLGFRGGSRHCGALRTARPTSSSSVVSERFMRTALGLTLDSRPALRSEHPSSLL